MKYKEWLDVWFANYIEPSSKTKTCERYSEIIEKHLKVKLGEYELEELSPIVIQKYITELMQSGNLTTGKGLAANSVNGIITVIQNSLKLAYTLGELKEYTTDKIRRPKTKEKEVSCFSLAEQKKIEQAALSNKKRKFIGIVICLYSGLRIGELLALTWSDIDFTKGTLAVNKTCHDGRDESGNLCRITDLPKTTSSKRMIPLPKQLLPVLKEYKRKSISEYVVESEKGEPSTVRSYTVVPEEAEVVRKIFALYLQGYGVNVIAKTIRDTDGDKRVWNRQGIKYILTNEKYIGDTMWQKSFTPAVLPLRNRPNRGELPKYYCEGTQEAIVSKEDFIAVKNLMREREEKHYKQYRNEKKLFYRKIMCRHCGWSYRVKQIQNGYVWACSRKGMIGGECSSRSYTDTELCRSFIKVYNILKQNKWVLLDETISQLQTLKVKANCGNNVIAEIDEKIAMLGRQNNLYGQMLANGVIDEVTYHEKADSIKGQITELRSRRMKIINDDDEETCIEQLRQLRKIIEESPDYLDEMDTVLFREIVKLIYAEEDGALSFVIKGDLELKVYVGGENDEQND